MVKTKFAALAAFIVAAMVAVASAQQATQAGVGAVVPDGKVVVLNTSRLPGEVSELKQKYEQVDGQFKDRYQRLEGMVNQLKALETDIRTKGPSLTQDKLQEMQNTYEDLKRRGAREEEDLKNEINRALGVSTKPVWDKVNQFLQNYASQRGIILIIALAGAAQSGSIAFVSPGTDITADFVTEYNKANPVAGATPPATQPKPQPTQPAGPKKP